MSANSRTDTIIYNSPNNNIWGGIDRLLWCGVQTGSSSVPAQHIARYMQTIRQSVGTSPTGALSHNRSFGQHAWNTVIQRLSRPVLRILA